MNRKRPEADTAAPHAYRPCVGVLLFNDDGRVLVAQRRDVAGEAWQLPQGGIDPGESPRAAALRELREEIGTDRVEVLAETQDWLRYDLPEPLAARRWDGRFRGQKQKWFALRFLGQDSEIDLETEHPEFRAWRWAELAELPGLAVGFKRPVYERLVEEFAPLVRRLREGRRDP